MSADIELPRRARACKHWRWLPGMVALFSEEHGGTASRIDDDPALAGSSEHADEAGALPDLRDAATQGCMLTLIAERTGSMSDTLADIAHRMRRGATLPQALVEALESCP